MSERLMDFAAAILKLATVLAKSPSGRHLCGQVIRSATSSGANYEEACGAESRADFIHKLQIVLKELKETRYWLLLIRKAELISSSALEQLIEESDELQKIIAKSVITAKKK